MNKGRRAVWSLLALAFVFVLLVPASTRAAPQSPIEALMQLETRWLTAIVNGDSKTIASILSPNFKHVTYQGQLLSRSDELQSVKKEKFTMNATDRIIDFAGDAAVIHGVNTISQSGKTLMRVRYTDVYVKQKGTWMALSSQESKIVP